MGWAQPNGTSTGISRWSSSARRPACLDSSAGCGFRPRLRCAWLSQSCSRRRDLQLLARARPLDAASRPVADRAGCSVLAKTDRQRPVLDRSKGELAENKVEKLVLDRVSSLV